MISSTTTHQTAPRQVSPPSFILLDPAPAWRKAIAKTEAVACTTADDIRKALQTADRDSVWISPRTEMTDELIRTAHQSLSRRPGRRPHFGKLLLLEAPRVRTLPFLADLFDAVIGGTQAFRTLPENMLIDVLAAPAEEVRDVFIGGVIDQKNGLLSLTRGNLEQVSVSLSIFHPSGTSRPNFRQFRLDDYGQTVCFGDYEASADFILFDADRDFRRRTIAKRHDEAKGFGPSLRRLRIQRGLSRTDFPGISSKTIARLERGDVERPHENTVRKIAATLGVAAEDLETY